MGFLREEGWDEIAKMILYKVSRFSMFCLLILLGCFLILWPITTNKMPSVGSSPTTRARICMNLLLVYIVLCVCSRIDSVCKNGTWKCLTNHVDGSIDAVEGISAK